MKGEQRDPLDQIHRCRGRLPDRSDGQCFFLYKCKSHGSVEIHFRQIPPFKKMMVANAFAVLSSDGGHARECWHVKSPVDCKYYNWYYEMVSEKHILTNIIRFCQNDGSKSSQDDKPRRKMRIHMEINNHEEEEEVDEGVNDEDKINIYIVLLLSITRQQYFRYHMSDELNIYIAIIFSG